MFEKVENKLVSIYEYRNTIQKIKRYNVKVHYLCRVPGGTRMRPR